MRKFQPDKGTIICPECSREETEAAGEEMYAYHKPPACEKTVKDADHSEQGSSSKLDS